MPWQALCIGIRPPMVWPLDAMASFVYRDTASDGLASRCGGKLCGSGYGLRWSVLSIPWKALCIGFRPLMVWPLDAMASFVHRDTASDGLASRCHGKLCVSGYGLRWSGLSVRWQALWIGIRPPMVCALDSLESFVHRFSASDGLASRCHGKLCASGYGLRWSGLSMPWQALCIGIRPPTVWPLGAVASFVDRDTASDGLCSRFLGKLCASVFGL